MSSITITNIKTSNISPIEIGHWASENGGNFASVLSSVSQELQDKEEIVGFVSELKEGLFFDDFEFLGELYIALSSMYVERYDAAILAKNIILATCKNDGNLTEGFAKKFSIHCDEDGLVFLEQLIAAARALKAEAKSEVA